MWFDWLIVGFLLVVAVTAIIAHHAPKIEMIRPLATFVLVGAIILGVVIVVLIFMSPATLRGGCY